MNLFFSVVNNTSCRQIFTMKLRGTLLAMLFTILQSYRNGLVQSIYTAKPKTEIGFGFSKSITALLL